MAQLVSNVVDYVLYVSSILRKTQLIHSLSIQLVYCSTNFKQSAETAFSFLDFFVMFFIYWVISYETFQKLFANCLLLLLP